MAKITVIISDELKSAIEEEAAEEERNLSWVIRKALQEHFDSQKVYKECQNDTE